MEVKDKPRDAYSFLTEFIQHNRKRPKKYKHYLKMPTYLFDELVNNGIIILEDLYIEGSAYFEFDELTATISFMNYCHIEDIHIKSLDYLVRKLTGLASPVQRGGNMF